MLDSLSIRKKIFYNASLVKSVSYISWDGIVDVDLVELATPALVFMIVP